MGIIDFILDVIKTSRDKNRRNILITQAINTPGIRLSLDGMELTSNIVIIPKFSDFEFFLDIGQALIERGKAIDPLELAQHQELWKNIFVTDITVIKKIQAFLQSLMHEDIIEEWKINVMYSYSKTPMGGRRRNIFKKYEDVEEYYKPPDWEFRRDVILKRDNYKCVLCGTNLKKSMQSDQSENSVSGHVHHIVHRSANGKHRFGNLVSLCRDCHASLDGHDKLYSRYLRLNEKSGIIHTYKCRFGKGLKALEGDPYKHQTCKQCKPIEYIQTIWKIRRSQQNEKILDYLLINHRTLGPQKIIENRPRLKIY